jgi:hypothetical protein
MPAGSVISAPIAPIPPAFATAMESPGGHEPAMGASRIGQLNPYLAQNGSARLEASAPAMYINIA